MSDRAGCLPHPGAVTYFSCYSLSVGQREILEASNRESEFLTLSSLRVLPLGRMWKTMRAVSTDELCVVTAARNERVLAPLLLTLGALSGAGQITELSLDDGRRTPVSRPLALLSILSSVRATLSGYILRAWYSLRAALLMRAEPMRFPPVRGAKALYLKTNLMFGTHAGGSVGHIAGVVNELHSRNQDMLVQALEFPVTVVPNVRFEAQESLKSYGIPPESNQLRFNRSTIASGVRALQREKFDFIYQRTTLANFSGVVLSRRFDVPLVIEYNGSEVWVSNNWGLPLNWTRTADRIERVCLKHATFVVTVSDALRADLIERGVPDERIVTYPNCIDPEKFDPRKYEAERLALRRKWLGDHEATVALFMGTFGAWHGAEVLADAINIWRRDRPSKHPLKFVFVGDGLRAAAVKGMLGDAIGDGDAIFTGLVSQGEAASYLAAADIFLSPHIEPIDGSRFFGSPTKLFEYMAMERPIIASCLEQIEQVLAPDDLDGEEVAVLVKPGSARAIVEAITQLMADPAKSAAMAANARRRVLSRYTWKEHVDRILAKLEGRS